MNALVCLIVFAAAITGSLSQTRPPPDPCRTCQIIINIARHHFNNTVNDKPALQTQLLLECQRLAQFEGQAAADACARIVNANIDIIYNDMHTSKTSLQTCQDINECPATTGGPVLLDGVIMKYELLQVPKLRQKRQRPNDPCRTCEFIVNIARHHFHNNVTDKAALQIQLLEECRRLAMFEGQQASDHCIQIVNSKIDQIYADMSTNKPARQTCTDIGECAPGSPAPELKRRRRQAHDPCRTCEIIIGIAKRHFHNMFNNKTALQAQLIYECNQLANHGFSASEVQGCINVINTNIDAIYTELVNNPNADPHKICQDFKECPMKAILRRQKRQMNNPCRTCEIIMNIARHHFNNTVNDEPSLKTQLLAECVRVGQIEGNDAGQHCTMIVNNNIDKIYNDLHTNKTSRQTCQDIGECPQGPMSPQEVFNSRRH